MEPDDDIFASYPAMRDRPREAAMLCALLVQRGLDRDAFRLGLAAMAQSPDDMAVRDEIHGVLSGGVAPFHGTMLTDRARNRAYLEAIARYVRPDMTVLEIGTGAGLLALAAARAGARVFTCEAHPRIAAAATAVIAHNGYADRVQVIAKRSTELMIPDDMPEPADLVIHEVFGHQLFDEGISRALADARTRLLKPGAPALPPRASLRVALARVTGEPRPDLGDIEGFDLSLFEPLVGPHRRSFGRGRVELVSDTRSALAMDYDTPPPFGPGRETLTLESRGGRVDGVLQWLRLDFGEGHVLENDPTADATPSHWGAPLYALPRAVGTAAGDAFDVTLRHRDRLVTIAANRA